MGWGGKIEMRTEPKRQKSRNISIYLYRGIYIYSERDRQ